MLNILFAESSEDRRSILAGLIKSVLLHCGARTETEGS